MPPSYEGHSNEITIHIKCLIQINVILSICDDDNSVNVLESGVYDVNGVRFGLWKG